jgi:hypothetical protein
VRTCEYCSESYDPLSSDAEDKLRFCSRVEERILEGNGLGD